VATSTSSKSSDRFSTSSRRPSDSFDPLKGYTQKPITPPLSSEEQVQVQPELNRKSSKGGSTPSMSEPTRTRSSSSRRGRATIKLEPPRDSNLFETQQDWEVNRHVLSLSFSHSSSLCRTEMSLLVDST